jgi:hypothetical protein
MAQNMKPDPQKKKKRPVKLNNPVEAIRDLGGNVVDSAVQDVGKGVAETAFNQIAGRQMSGDLEPNQTLDIQKEAQDASQKTENLRQGFYQEFLDIRRQERQISVQVEQETKLQIAAVLEELKQISFSTKKLAKEVKVASEQVPADPGVYHINFFERLRKTLVFLRKKIDESATWLSAFNQRSKKRNYYWGQVKKSGGKFMLSQERYMATQAG